LLHGSRFLLGSKPQQMLAWCAMVRCGMVRCAMVRCGMGRCVGPQVAVVCGRPGATQGGCQADIRSGKADEGRNGKCDDGDVRSWGHVALPRLQRTAGWTI